MTPATHLHLKQPTGWFAAGREIEQALILLSDRAFKLFLWLCLHAERSRGSLQVSPAELASALHRTEREIKGTLDELLQLRVCNAAAAGVIEIADRFWPYQRAPNPGTTEDLALYIAQVKRAFLERRCVQSTFSPADDKLAAQLYLNGLSVADAERAILLGSARKYASWKNHGIGTPITTLHYFQGVFDELRNTTVPSTYWTYIEYTIRQLEQQWDESRFTPQQETK